MRKIERRERVPAAEFGAFSFPMEASGDHQMQYEPPAVIKPDCDALADSTERAYRMSFKGCDRRRYRAKQKRIREPHLLKRLIYDPRLQSTQISRDVGQFWHEWKLARR